MPVRQPLDANAAYLVPAPMRSDLLRPALHSAFGEPVGGRAFGELLRRLDGIPARR